MNWGDGEVGKWGDHFVRVAGGDGEMGRWEQGEKS